MTGLNHTLSGAIIALITPAPLVPAVAFGLHLLLDALPHFGRHERIYPYTREFIYLLVADAVLCFAALGFAIWLVPDRWQIIMVGAFFATLPDFMWLLSGRVDWLSGFFKFASRIQWGERPWGWMLELVYAAVFTIILLQITS